ncbi:MAG: hypothetical protein ACT4OU_10755 [Hyphomicrobium sp.]
MSMETGEKSWASRLLRNPIAIIGAIGSVLVVLANANPAIDGVSNLWGRWAEPPPPLETTWQGTWTSRDGYRYDFAMQLNVADSGVADGQIRWDLVATPAKSHIADRVGHSATEFVSGTFDRVKGLADVDGYKVSDPTLIALDSYKFQLKPDRISFVGMTKHRGEWEAQAGGTVIVTEVK